jgi:hypothetical protein
MRRHLAAAAAGVGALVGLSCGSDRVSPPAVPSPAVSAPAPVDPLPPTATPPASSSCRWGPGTLDTACAPGAERYEAEVNAAIDRLAERRPDVVDMTSSRGPGEWRVLRPRDYLTGVVSELQARRFCAETDEAAMIFVRSGSEFSESWDILHPTGHVRRGNRAYVETCSPPNFPVAPRDAIAYVRVHFFGITCEDGITAPRNGENVLPIGCRGAVTATPKQRNNVDVPRHIVGSDIAWRLEQSGEVVAIHDDRANAFNKTAVGLNPGRYTLCATVHGIEGCQSVEVVRDPRR